MDTQKLKEYWKSEEQKARIIGWDFSYIEDRFESEENDLPWNYKDVINKYRNHSQDLLDIDTGGGEFLLSLGHPFDKTWATEGYPPNVMLCREKLGRLGIGFCEVNNYGNMPFPDGSFDIIIDRHGSYEPEELYRLLKPGGFFITQQVGEDNDRELVKLLLPEAEKMFKGHNLADCVEALKKAGFEILESGEAYRSIRFYDTGALVWFAGIIEWEFIGFSVDKCFEQLLEAEAEIRKNGSVSGRIHRFYIAAKKI